MPFCANQRSDPQWASGPAFREPTADTTSLQHVQLDLYRDPTSGVPYDEISNLALDATIFAQDFGVASVSITGGTPSSGGKTYQIDNILDDVIEDYVSSSDKKDRVS